MDHSDYILKRLLYSNDVDTIKTIGQQKNNPG